MGQLWCQIREFKIQVQWTENKTSMNMNIALLTNSNKLAKSRTVPEHMHLVVGFSPRRHGFVPRAVNARFVEQSSTGIDLYSSLLVFSCQQHSSGTLYLFIHSCIIRGTDNGPVSGSSTETQSHLIASRTNSWFVSKKKYIWKWNSVGYDALS
jgi:hypothetical protein